MGPRPFSRGNHPYPSHTYGQDTRLQWGHDLSVVETRLDKPRWTRRTRFNGATTFQSWKPDRMASCSSARDWLQWGHDLSVVETAATEYARAPEWLLLQWGHDLSVVETGDVEIEMRDAIMLQWGHDLSVVETYAQDGYAHELIELQWGHDLSVVETYDGRGRGAWPSMLQWGHDLSVVETWLPGLLAPQVLGLQWGHDLSVVETPSVAGGEQEIEIAGNGATTFQSWKPRLGGRPMTIRVQLQWGHDLSVVETRAYAEMTGDASCASMGPRPFSRGNSLLDSITVNYSQYIGRSTQTLSGLDRLLVGYHALQPYARGVSPSESASASYLTASRSDSSREDCQYPIASHPPSDCTILKRPSLRVPQASAAFPACLESRSLGLRLAQYL